MDKILFEKLIQQEESITLDFKKEFYKLSGNTKEEKEFSQSSFIKDLLAFANTKREESAFIILGITDLDKSQIGIEKHDSNELLTVLKNRLNQIPNFHYENFEYSGKNFGIIEIFVNPSPMPYRGIKDIGKVKANITYIRRGASIDEASLTEEKSIIDWFDNINSGQKLKNSSKNSSKIFGLILISIFLISIISYTIYKKYFHLSCEYLPNNPNYKIDCLTDILRSAQCYFYIPVDWDKIEPPVIDFAFQDRYRLIVNPLDTTAYISVCVDMDVFNNDNPNRLDEVLQAEISRMFQIKDTTYDERKNLKIINKYPITINIISFQDENNDLNLYSKSYAKFDECIKYEYPSFKIKYEYLLNKTNYIGYKGFTIADGMFYSVDCICKKDDLAKYEKDFSYITANFLPAKIIVAMDKK